MEFENRQNSVTMKAVAMDTTTEKNIPLPQRENAKAIAKTRQEEFDNSLKQIEAQVGVQEKALREIRTSMENIGISGDMIHNAFVSMARTSEGKDISIKPIEIMEEPSLDQLVAPKATPKGANISEIRKARTTQTIIANYEAKNPSIGVARPVKVDSGTRINEVSKSSEKIKR